MSYDTRCHDLAAIFLGDTPDIHNKTTIAELAQHIQDTIEDYISYKEGPCECCGEARGKEVNGKNAHENCVLF